MWIKWDSNFWYVHSLQINNRFSVDASPCINRIVTFNFLTYPFRCLSPSSASTDRIHYPANSLRITSRWSIVSCCDSNPIFTSSYWTKSSVLSGAFSIIILNAYGYGTFGKRYNIILELSRHRRTCRSNGETRGGNIWVRLIRSHLIHLVLAFAFSGPSDASQILLNAYVYICSSTFSLLTLEFWCLRSFLFQIRFACLMSDVLDMFSYSDSLRMYFYFSNDCCTSRRWKLGLQKCYGNVYILSIEIELVLKLWVQFNVSSPSTEWIFILHSCSSWNCPTCQLLHSCIIREDINNMDPWL